MAHVITGLCTNSGPCLDVCPVECIILGAGTAPWPHSAIDPVTCIDCGVCIPVCPTGAIFVEAAVPEAFPLPAGRTYVAPDGRRIEGGQGVVVDLRPDIAANAAFFETGPGYTALDGLKAPDDEE